MTERSPADEKSPSKCIDERIAALGD